MNVDVQELEEVEDCLKCIVGAHNKSSYVLFITRIAKMEFIHSMFDNNTICKCTCWN